MIEIILQPRSFLTHPPTSLNHTRNCFPSGRRRPLQKKMGANCSPPPVSSSLADWFLWIIITTFTSKLAKNLSGVLPKPSPGPSPSP